ncbi:Bug family tripartite tricarboxylate transporter substrate binding protein [Alkalispirochaeta sphaeroplastigenens]|nr:tripartite tricarboxylate transporter substrate binding protein [Alkalispirochaeta sphaeroplastigenens]
MKKTGIAMILVCFLASLAFAGGQGEKGADAFPSRTPTIVIGYGAGGGTDTAIRPIVAEMEKFFGRSITVVNMPGADSAVAADYVLNQKADGYTWFGTGNSALAVMLKLRGLSNTDWREWETLMTVIGPSLLVVRKDSPIRTMDDVIEYFQREDVVAGVTGLGSEPHLFIDEVHSLSGGRSITYTPYGGCHPAAVAVIRREADIAPVAMSAVLDFVRAGEVHPIVAFGTTEPVEIEIDGKTVSIPNIGAAYPPAAHLENIQESWPIYVPRSVPVEIRRKIREAFEWAVQQPSVQEFADSRGLLVSGVTGEEADRIMSFVESNVGWALEAAGIAEHSPASFDIPKPEDWVWPPAGWNVEY